MNPATNPHVAKDRTYLVAVGDADNVEVICMPTARQFERQGHLSRVFQSCPIKLTNLATALGPCVQIREFHTQDSRLQSCQTMVVTNNFMDIFGAAAMLAQQA